MLVSLTCICPGVFRLSSCYRNSIIYSCLIFCMACHSRFGFTELPPDFVATAREAGDSRGASGFGDTPMDGAGDSSSAGDSNGGGGDFLSGDSSLRVDGDGAGGGDACVGETNAELCVSLSALCGNPILLDSCGTNRTLECGFCVAPETCGGGSVPLTCGSGGWTTLTADDGWSGGSGTRVTWGSAAGEGVSGTSTVDAWTPSLAVDGLGRPVVVWAGDDWVERHVFVVRWDGSLWRELDGSGSGDGISGPITSSAEPNIAIDADGDPIVVWQQGNDIYLRRWNGLVWEELDGSASVGGLSNTSDPSSTPDVAVDSAGTIYVVWREFGVGLDSRIFFKQWTAANGWTALGTNSAKNNGLCEANEAGSAPRVVVGSDNLPVVVWHHNSSFDGIYLKKWDGAAWVELVASATDAGLNTNIASSVLRPRVRLDADNNPTVIWLDLPPDYVGDFFNVCLKRWNGIAWEEVLGSGTGTCLTADRGTITEPDLLLNATGEPLVAFSQTDATATSNIFSLEPGVSAWAEFPSAEPGNRLNLNIAGANSVKLGSAPAGPPVAVYRSSLSGTSQIYAVYYDSGRWREYGISAQASLLSANSTTSATKSLLAISDNGNIHLAWTGTMSGPENVYYQFWDGLQWQGTGSSLSPGGLSGLSSGGWMLGEAFTLDSAGNPIVAWAYDIGFNFYSAVRRWDGTDWTYPVGSAGEHFTDGAWDSAQVAVASNASAQLVVAWTADAGADFEVLVKAYQGGEWVDFAGSGTAGGVSNSGPWVTRPVLAVFSDGRPLVAWENYATSARKIFLKQWTGAVWQEMGGDSGGLGLFAGAVKVRAPALVIDSTDRTVIAWSEENLSGIWQVRLQRWTGSAWEQLGASAGADGLSNTPGDSISPSIALDGSDNPIVVWTDHSSGVNEIYLRHWDGTSWQEVQGSASAGGISNSNASSYSAVAAWHDGMICVLWTEADLRGAQAMLRCRR